MSKSGSYLWEKVLAVAVSVFTVFSGIPIRAEESNVDDLFKLVSSLSAQTPTLSPMSLSKTPGTVSVITQEQIKALGVTTLDQLLAYLPGVDAVYSSMGFAGNIRGFGSSPFQEGVQY